MGCASSSFVGLHRMGVVDPKDSAVQKGPRRLSMRPHSLETRILQVDQVDTLLQVPLHNTEPEEPFVDGRLGIGDLPPSAGAGGLFCDPDFPVDVAVAGLGLAGFSGFPESSGVRWVRPAELGVKGPVWTGECRGRIQHGMFRDRWLSEAMAVVSQRPHLLDQVFVGGGVPGAVRVRLWRFGRWETVVVDDRIPVPLCISSDARGEVWPAVLEKALAKIHGGYAGLAGGDVLWGLEDLTGGVSQRVHVPEEPVPLPTDPQGTVVTLGPLRVPRERDSLYGQVFRPLMHALRYGALVSCVPAHDLLQVSSPEIVVSTVVDTKVTIRGPQLHVQDDEGSPPQWWGLEDFVREYTNIVVTTISTGSDELKVQETYGRWEVGINAGGSRNNLEKFAINPQYILTVNHPEGDEKDRDFGRCSLLLALMQEHRRSKRGCRPPLLPIAYFIYKADVPGERLSAEYFLCVPEEVETGPFTNKREIAHRAELEPGNYVVIPATWTSGQEGAFMLRIFTVRKVTLEALPTYKPMCAMLPTWVPVTET